MTREDFINWFEERFALTKNDIYEFGQLYDEATKPQWISVEDELPPLGCSMIVLISYGEDIQISEWDNGLFHETKLGAIIHPTYWMPLPQAPKKGGNQ